MLFDKIFLNPKWAGKDDFPSSDEWKIEINNWLEFIKSKGEIERFIPRLNSKRTQQRDETLAEISSAYLIEKHLNYPIISWEQNTVKKKDVEFVIKCNSDKVYCEVKSPGWEGELKQKERMSVRKKFPKYQKGEGRFYSLIEPIKYTIEKAYPKFLNNTKNLLIINDDFFVSIF